MNTEGLFIYIRLHVNLNEKQIICLHGENNIIYTLYNTKRNFIFAKLHKRLCEFEQVRFY